MLFVAWRSLGCGILIASAAVLAGCSNQSQPPRVVAYVPSGPLSDAHVCSEVQAAGTNVANTSARQAQAVGTLALDADKIADSDLKSAAERLSSDIRGNHSTEANSALQALRSRCESLGLTPP